MKKFTLFIIFLLGSTSLFGAMNDSPSLQIIRENLKKDSPKNSPKILKKELSDSSIKLHSNDEIIALFKEANKDTRKKEGPEKLKVLFSRLPKLIIDTNELIFDAIEKENSVILEVYVKNGASINHIFNADGHMPIHVAVRKLLPNMVKALYLLKADLNIRTRKKEETPFHMLAYSNTDKSEKQNNLKEIAEFLKKKGARLGRADSNGNFPLHTAAFENQLDAVKWLINHFEKEHWLNNEKKQTPLHLATMGKTADAVHVVSTLINDGEFSIMDKDFEGNTPFHNAASVDNKIRAERILDVLRLNDGCDMKKVDEKDVSTIYNSYQNIKGLTAKYIFESREEESRKNFQRPIPPVRKAPTLPVFRHVKHSTLKTEKSFFSNNSSLTTSPKKISKTLPKPKRPAPPIPEFKEQQKTSVGEDLPSIGKDLNRLHKICREGKLKVEGLSNLIKNQVLNVNEKDHEGNTPLHILIKEYQNADSKKKEWIVEAIKIMKNLEAKIDIANKQKETPLSLAIQSTKEILDIIMAE